MSDKYEPNPHDPPSDNHDVYWRVQVAEARRDDPGSGRGLLSTIIGFLDRGQPLPPSLQEYLVEILRASLVVPTADVDKAMHINRPARRPARPVDLDPVDQACQDHYLKHGEAGGAPDGIDRGTWGQWLKDNHRYCLDDFEIL